MCSYNPWTLHSNQKTNRIHRGKHGWHWQPRIPKGNAEVEDASNRMTGAAALKSKSEMEIKGDEENIN